MSEIQNYFTLQKNNTSTVSDYKDFSSEPVLKTHVGAFARLGYGHLYVQPEAYYSAKGADFKSGIVRKTVLL